MKRKATFGLGCFWCAEALFKRVDGVLEVISGYSGGETKAPSYDQVCREETGHAEVVQITYDSDLLTYSELLEVFWKMHDPTTPNRQGNDVGTQYRSVIFYHSEEQREEATAQKNRLSEMRVWKDPIVTEISKLDAFYPAEEYHHDYFKRNASQPYCSLVIAPKIEKFDSLFSDKRSKR